MAEKTAPRVTRMLGIVTYLELHGEATIEALAARFGVSVNQIRRDVETLWVSGVPGYGPQDLIDFDPWAFDEGIIRLTNSQGIGQVRLSAREAVALMGALRAVVAGGAAPEPVHTALAKLTAAVGDADAVLTTPARPVDQAITSKLTEALERGRVLHLTYVDAADARSSRTVEPHRIVVIDGVSYLECFCQRAQDYRTLRLDRMESAEVGDEAVTAPPSEQGGFSLQPRYEAVVEAARWSRWALDAIPGVRIDDDGTTVIARFGVANERAIAARLLAIAPALTRVEPASLATAIGTQAQAILAAHA